MQLISIYLLCVGLSVLSEVIAHASTAKQLKKEGYKTSEVNMRTTGSFFKRFLLNFIPGVNLVMPVLYAFNAASVKEEISRGLEKVTSGETSTSTRTEGSAERTEGSAERGTRTEARPRTIPFSELPFDQQMEYLERARRNAIDRERERLEREERLRGASARATGEEESPFRRTYRRGLFDEEYTERPRVRRITREEFNALSTEEQNEYLLRVMSEMEESTRGTGEYEETGPVFSRGPRRARPMRRRPSDEDSE